MTPVWRARDRTFALDRPLVMGVLNLTPDSFSDGGRFRDVQEALDAARAMGEQGAGLIDVGGESTRPGASAVSVGEELRRVLPLVEAAKEALDVPISIDTRKAEVASEALAAGAVVVNDVSGLTHDDAMAPLVAESGAGLVLMHMRGEPHDMARHAAYDDVVAGVAEELEGAVGRARDAGVADEALVLDPGLGFAKDAAQSLELLARLDVLCALGRPVLVGPSRKSFLGAVLDVPADERLAGTLAACVMAYLAGARIFRVHDVLPVVQALAVAEAIERARPDGLPPGRR